MNVHIIPMFEDNYSYLIVDEVTRKAAIVDPAQADTVIKEIEKIERDFYSSCHSDADTVQPATTLTTTPTTAIATTPTATTTTTTTTTASSAGAAAAITQSNAATDTGGETGSLGSAPSSGNIAVDAASSSSSSPLALVAILTTHHHSDHAGGNESFLKLAAQSSHPSLSRFAQMVPGEHFVYGYDDRIPALTTKLAHGDTFKIGSTTVTALFTPCHTSGSVSYLATSNSVPDAEVSETWKGKTVLREKRCVFTGDTLFVGGCGRFFEGTAEQMYHSLVNVLGSLRPSTHVYCGHEYTVSNLRYGMHVEPENTNIEIYLHRARQLRDKRLFTVPSTLADEFLINPFVRVRDAATVKYFARTLGVREDPVEVMRALRTAKDSFKPSK